MPLSRINNPFLSSSGAGNASITSPAANTVAFTTATTERMRIDSSGNVGIGTATPASYGKFAVAGTSTFGVDQTDYIAAIGGGGTGRVETVGGNTDINLALSTKGTGSTYFWRGGYGGTQMALINQYGIGLGATTPSSGTGITFPATQSASSNANTLDDYEEGSWTPSFGSFDGTYSVRQAVYTKIGKVVTVQVHMSAATLGTSSSNTISVSGFPFAALAGSTYGVSSSVHGTSWVTPRTSPNILMAGSSTAGAIYINQFSGASGFNPLYSEMGTSGNLLFSMTYISNN
jgi:hypothetical protein